MTLWPEMTWSARIAAEQGGKLFDPPTPPSKWEVIKRKELREEHFASD